MLNSPVTHKSRKPNQRQVVLMGGGVDSSAVLSRTVATSHSLNNVYIIHIDYKQKARLAEWDACCKQANYYNIPLDNVIQIGMDFTYATCGIMPNGEGVDTSKAVNNVLELRNPLIIMQVASYLATRFPGEDFKLCLGFHLEPQNTPYRDALSGYLSNLNGVIKDTLSNSKTNFWLDAPFRTRTRERILASLVRDRGEFFVKEYVHSCYEDKPCGVCTHCVWLNKQLRNFR